MQLSIVIPTYNEEQNVGLLYQELRSVLDQLGIGYELIFVDDGSRDGTLRHLLSLKAREKGKKKLRVVQLRRNFGQTAAIMAGVKEAKGNIIITLDADLQNDPADIPRLLQKMEEGQYDVVSGWRYQRQDPLMKRFLSRIAYLLRVALSGERTHDSGCTLKAYRKECFDDLELYGEMHRFIPALLKWKGFRIGELKVQHRQRRFGTTKYTVKRVFKGFLDLLVVAFWQKYSARPIHLFGFLGFLLGLFGIICGIIAVYLKIAENQDLSETFLPTLSILSVILGVQFLLSGILADIAIKTYYKQSSKNYAVKRVY